jgi:hypothetical protein
MSVIFLPRYSKRTMSKVESQAKKRRAMRTKRVNLSELRGLIAICIPEILLSVFVAWKSGCDGRKN